MVETWIKMAYDFEGEEDLDALYNEKISVNFLLVWAKFEVINFEGFLKFEKIDKVAKQIAEKESFLILELESYVKYFYDRYVEQLGGQRRLNGLCYKIDACREKKSCVNLSCEIKRILNEKLETLTKKDKVYFLIYVISRYRNNMFHGNKNAKNWISEYKIPIENCIRVMVLLTEIPKGD